MIISKEFFVPKRRNPAQKAGDIEPYIGFENYTSLGRRGPRNKRENQACAALRPPETRLFRRLLFVKKDVNSNHKSIQPFFLKRFNLPPKGEILYRTGPGEMGGVSIVGGGCNVLLPGALIP